MPVFSTVLFIVAQREKLLKGQSTNEWIDKMWYVYTMKYFSAIKSNGILTGAKTDETWKHATWKSHTQKDKYCMISLLWNIRITKFVGVESRLKVTSDLGLGEIEGERRYCFMLTKFPFKGMNSFGNKEWIYK